MLPLKTILNIMVAILSSPFFAFVSDTPNTPKVQVVPAVKPGYFASLWTTGNNNQLGPSPYDLLGVTINSSNRAIAKSYKTKYKSAWRRSRKQLIQKSYDTLTDQYLRCKYHRDTGTTDWYGVPKLCTAELAIDTLQTGKSAINSIPNTSLNRASTAITGLTVDAKIPAQEKTKKTKGAKDAKDTKKTQAVKKAQTVKKTQTIKKTQTVKESKAANTKSNYLGWFKTKNALRDSKAKSSYLGWFKSNNAPEASKTGNSKSSYFSWSKAPKSATNTFSNKFKTTKSAIGAATGKSSAKLSAAMQKVKGGFGLGKSQLNKADKKAQSTIKTGQGYFSSLKDRVSVPSMPSFKVGLGGTKNSGGSSYFSGLKNRIQVPTVKVSAPKVFSSGLGKSQAQGFFGGLKKRVSGSVSTPSFFSKLTSTKSKSTESGWFEKPVTGKAKK